MFGLCLTKSFFVVVGIHTLTFHDIHFLVFLGFRYSMEWRDRYFPEEKYSLKIRSSYFHLLPPTRPLRFACLMSSPSSSVFYGPTSKFSAVLLKEIDAGYNTLVLRIHLALQIIRMMHHLHS
jgi:hypothetical protein